MKVFVGFGYNDRDKWIAELIIPFLKELGCEVVTGEAIHGEILSIGVKEKIKESDACLGFLTRRGDAGADGIFPTHNWVISEMATALAFDKIIFELREKNIDPQKGMTGDRQWYEFEDKAMLMLEIAKFISKEKAKMTYKTFMLLPNEFSEAIRQNAKYAKCTYRFLYKARLYDPEETSLVKMMGGYSIILRKIPSEEAQVEINVEAPGNQNWNSGFVSVGAVNVHLQKE